MYLGGYYFDWTYVLVLIGAVISMIASANVKGTFRRYNTTFNSRGLTAEQAAQAILNEAGIYDVTIERIRGNAVCIIIVVQAPLLGLTSLRQ